MTTISWTFNIQITGGPQIALSESKTIEAYDKIELVIDANDNAEKSVDIQPCDAKQVHFLLIKSNLYGEQLTYKVCDGSSVDPKESPLIIMYEPQLYLGKEAIRLLIAAPKIIKFTNKLGKNVAIEILVGRNAIST